MNDKSNSLSSDNKPTCRMYLIRHGETANAGDVCFNGHFDVDLSERGKNQSRRFADALKNLPIRAVYCSDLKRTLLGAQYVADHHGITSVLYPELRELSFGAWEGLSVDEVNRKYPDQLRKRLENIETFHGEDGESFLQLRARAIPKFEEIVSKHPEDCIAIICHGGVIRTFLAHVLGIPMKNMFRVHQPYAAINIIQFYEEGNPIVELTGGSCDNIHPPNSLDKEMFIQ